MSIAEKGPDDLVGFPPHHLKALSCGERQEVVDFESQLLLRIVPVKFQDHLTRIIPDAAARGQCRIRAVGALPQQPSRLWLRRAAWPDSAAAPGDIDGPHGARKKVRLLRKKALTRYVIFVY